MFLFYFSHFCAPQESAPGEEREPARIHAYRAGSYLCAGSFGRDWGWYNGAGQAARGGGSAHAEFRRPRGCLAGKEGEFRRHDRDRSCAEACGWMRGGRGLCVQRRMSGAEGGERAGRGVRGVWCGYACLLRRKYAWKQGTACDPRHVGVRRGMMIVVCGGSREEGGRSGRAPRAFSGGHGPWAGHRRRGCTLQWRCTWGDFFGKYGQKYLYGGQRPAAKCSGQPDD